MSKRIIFLESPAHAHQALKLIKRDRDSHLVALSANVIWVLEKAGQPYSIPYDYHESDEELRELNEQLYKRTEDICNFLDRFYLLDIVYFEQNNFAPGHALFHPIKAALNTICHRMLNIRAVLVSERPTEAIIYHDRNTVGRTYRFFAKFTEIHLTLIRLLTRKLGIDFQIIYDEQKRGLSRSLPKRTVSIRIRKVYSILQSATNRIKKFSELDFRNEEEGIKRDNDLFTFMVLKNYYSIKIFGQYFQQNRLGRIFDLNQHSVAKQPDTVATLDSDVKKVWAQLCEDKSFVNLFCFGDIALLHEFEDVFFNIVQKGLTDVVLVHHKTHDALKKKIINSVLLPTITYPDEWGCMKACKQMSIPVFVWQHGSYAMFDPHTQPIYCDIKNADCFLCFGEGVKQAYKKEANQYKTQIVPVGSSSLDQLEINPLASNKNKKQKYSAMKKVVMPLRGIDVSYLGDSYQIYPPDKYWIELQKVLKLFKEFASIEFILKLYPANNLYDNPLVDFLKTNEIKNVILKTRPGFPFLLKNVDLVIIDWPYTTLLEAAKTNLPIICYNRYWILRKGVQDLLRKRCFVTEDLKTLRAFLNDFLDEALTPLVDEELLCHFGTYKNDGKSCLRTAETMRNYISS